ncbi:MAG: hypothetical protein HY978_04040 [Candidatus Liptonbacteria bacterium]|nr:hypothetical protein [Candidatus Liptonbacteria bacterium]
MFSAIGEREKLTVLVSFFLLGLIITYSYLHVDLRSRFTTGPVDVNTGYKLEYLATGQDNHPTQEKSSLGEVLLLYPAFKILGWPAVNFLQIGWNVLAVAILCSALFFVSGKNLWLAVTPLIGGAEYWTYHIGLDGLLVLISSYFVYRLIATRDFAPPWLTVLPAIASLFRPETGLLFSGVLFFRCRICGLIAAIEVIIVFAITMSFFYGNPIGQVAYNVGRSNNLPSLGSLIFWGWNALVLMFFFKSASLPSPRWPYILVLVGWVVFATIFFLKLSFLPRLTIYIPALWAGAAWAKSKT